MMQARLGRRIMRPLQSGPKGKTMIDKSMLYIVAILLGLLLAAYRPIQPVSAAKDAPSSGRGVAARPPGPADPTTILLTDGMEHAWASDGTTLALDGEHANDASEDGDSSDDRERIVLTGKTLL